MIIRCTRDFMVAAGKKQRGNWIYKSVRLSETSSLRAKILNSFASRLEVSDHLSSTFPFVSRSNIMHRPATYLALMALISAALSAPQWSNNYITPNDKEAINLERHDAQDPANHPLSTLHDPPFYPICRRMESYSDPYDCTKFYQCSDVGAVPQAFFCPSGLSFNVEIAACDAKYNVNC